MRRGERRQVGVERGDLDLTPMIDIVFNLVIFFMVVSELSNLDVEQVALPTASQARDPQPEVARVLHLNVRDTGAMLVRGRPCTADPAARDGGTLWLPDLLQAEAAGCERELAPDGGMGPSALRVHLRVDRAARFEHVQRVLDACLRERIWKTSLAATRE